MRQVNLTGLSGATAAALLAGLVCAGPARAGVIVVDFEDLEAETVLPVGELFRLEGVSILVQAGGGRGSPSASIRYGDDTGNTLRIFRRAEFHFTDEIVEFSFRFGGDYAEIDFGPEHPDSTFVLREIAMAGTPVVYQEFTITALLDPEDPLDGIATIEAQSGTLDLIRIGAVDPHRERPVHVDDLALTLHVPQPTILLVMVGYGVYLARRRTRRPCAGFDVMR